MGEEDQTPKTEKPCRACTDFKSWTGRTKRNMPAGSTTPGTNGNGSSNGNAASQDPSQPPPDCPLDKDGLGRQTWGFLHTMAAYYPESPTVREQKEMSVFIKLFSKFYPCDHCARDLREEIKECPPVTTSRTSFSQWMCQMHNIVNRKLGKEEFDCKLVDERWRDGWNSGECD